MTTTVRFHFDPLCPWAWQSSKWIREVERVRDVEFEWRLFSLQLINQNSEDPLADVHAKGTPALRALALVRRMEGNEGVGRLYEALGDRIHEAPSEELNESTVRSSLQDAGLNPSTVDQALSDESTMQDVRDQHAAVVLEVGAFGVSTILLETGQGMFGPVIAKAPKGEAAGELWDRVAWLIRQDGFFELKRERDRKPGG